MQKFLTLIITGAIIYMIFQQSMNSMKPPEHLQKPGTTSQEQKPAEFSGNFIEKTISGVLLNVLKTLKRGSQGPFSNVRAHLLD